jgi:hypothetical protein
MMRAAQPMEVQFRCQAKTRLGTLALQIALVVAQGVEPCRADGHLLLRHVYIPKPPARQPEPVGRSTAVPFRLASRTAWRSALTRTCK